MENIYDPIKVVVGHQSLFSRRVNIDEIIEVASHYSVSDWLELLAKIEGFLLVSRKDIADPDIFVAKSIFPKSTLDRIGRKSVDKKSVVFSVGQLNLAKKIAILYGKSDNYESIPRLFDELPSVDVSKFLLGIQDFHNQYDERVGEKGDFGNFCQFGIRNGYMNGNFDVCGLFITASQMYIVEAEKIPMLNGKTFADFFKENVGLTIEQAMALNFGLVHSFFQSTDVLANDPIVIDLDIIFKNLTVDKKIIDSLIQSQVIDVQEATEKIQQELGDLDFTAIPAGYNLDIFRKTPLLRLNNGKLVCVNLPCLFQKVTQNIIWLPKSQIKGLSKEQKQQLVNDLTKYRGQLFEAYIKTLCELMESKNQNAKFYYIPPESTTDNEEVGDAILIQEGKVLILEAKSRQFLEDFKYTGDWEQDKLFIEELVEKASKQIQIAAEKIKEGKLPQLNIHPSDITRVYPVIVTYEPVPMHGKIQRFIREKVKEFGYLENEIYAPLEIIDINDLETHMDIANQYTLIDILEQKDVTGGHASETNFHNFFAFFVSENNILSNGWQHEKFGQVLSDIIKPNLPFKDGV